LQLRGALRARLDRPDDPAEQHDEVAAFQLIELHSIPVSQAGLHGIESAMVVSG
jgi:hypothetical protein